MLHTLLISAWAEHADAPLELMRTIRRHLHAQPELSGMEYETQDFLERELKALGLTVSRIAGTGLKAVYDTGRDGPVIAFRAETDALPIQEATDLAFASERRGVMHACGHDMHAAILCGVAATVTRSPSLGGQYVFLFQPAEEGILSSVRHGAERMVEEGALLNPVPEYIFALHVMDNMDVGRVGLVKGQALAFSQPFRITVRGDAGHPANTRAGPGPLDTLARLVDSWGEFAGEGFDEGAVSFGRMHAGTTYNVVPGSGQLEGSMRSFNAHSLDASIHLFEDHVERICHDMGAAYEIEYGSRYDAVHNDPLLVQRLLDEVKGGDTFTWVDVHPLGAADDFAVYQESVPGAYIFLGAVSSYMDVGLMHSDNFKPSEEAMRAGHDVLLGAVQMLQAR